MAKNLSGQIVDKIGRTLNTRQGISELVDEAEKAIDEIDEELSEYLAQRKTLVSIVEDFDSIYATLFDEDLRSGAQLRDLRTLPSSELRPGDKAREAVLKAASNLIDVLGSASASQVVSELEDDRVAIPWKNPNAVVATILSKSGQYQKNEKGEFIHVDINE